MRKIGWTVTQISIPTTRLMLTYLGVATPQNRAAMPSQGLSQGRIGGG